MYWTWQRVKYMIYMLRQNIISIENKDLGVSPEKHVVKVIRPKLEYACAEIRKKLNCN